jgi:hypothetical protein
MDWGLVYWMDGKVNFRVNWQYGTCNAPGGISFLPDTALALYFPPAHTYLQPSRLGAVVFWQLMPHGSALRNLSAGSKWETIVPAVLNLGGRFVWTLTLTSTFNIQNFMSETGFIMLTAMIEVFRRGVWCEFYSKSEIRLGMWGVQHAKS